MHADSVRVVGTNALRRARRKRWFLERARAALNAVRHYALWYPRKWFPASAGQSIAHLHPALAAARAAPGLPQLVIADTAKGKGVAALEEDILCHVRTLAPAEIAAALEVLS